MSVSGLGGGGGGEKKRGGGGVFFASPFFPSLFADPPPTFPLSKLLANKGQYWEAVVHSIDPATKEIVACFPKDSGLDEACFKVDYDVLVLAVGCTTNTFGVKGVEEHAFFFKSIDDAASLRRHVSECFERAALPQTPPEEKDKLLSFVVCGGGPTGVEVAAELHDMMTEDLVKLYPALTPHVRVRIIELQDHLLSTYDRAISEYTGKQFARAGIDTILGARVLEVVGEGTGKGCVRVQGADGSQTDIPFGACVWATGVAMHPLVKQLASKLPAGTQTHFRSAVTNGYLEVDGSDGSIFALGDAATLRQDRALDAAAALFDRADIDNNGALDLDELRSLLATASDEFPQFKEHAKFLDSRRGFARWGGMVGAALERARARAAGVIASSETPLSTLDDDTALTREEFAELLGSIDRGLRALPATAQVAKQQVRGGWREGGGREGCTHKRTPHAFPTPPLTHTHTHTHTHSHTYLSLSLSGRVPGQAGRRRPRHGRGPRGTAGRGQGRDPAPRLHLLPQGVPRLRGPSQGRHGRPRAGAVVWRGRGAGVALV